MALASAEPEHLVLATSAAVLACTEARAWASDQQLIQQLRTVTVANTPSPDLEGTPVIVRGQPRVTQPLPQCPLRLPADGEVIALEEVVEEEREVIEEVKGKDGTLVRVDRRLEWQVVAVNRHRPPVQLQGYVIDERVLADSLGFESLGSTRESSVGWRATQRRSEWRACAVGHVSVIGVQHGSRLAAESPAGLVRLFSVQRGRVEPEVMTHRALAGTGRLWLARGAAVALSYIAGWRKGSVAPLAAASAAVGCLWLCHRQYRSKAVRSDVQWRTPPEDG
eukprot:TRINITY_DN12705_c0_g1_i1.p2 TRINITY_DN12705_c0_g1~~TRINITY_DN12705_c0_g1_i1.p2  ORF type:complete len:306 (+),score=88.21 TRINITY_DN12705_c0_g1_i1:80-919(+)